MANVIVLDQVNPRLRSLLEFLRGFPNGSLGQPRLSLTYQVNSWNIRINSGDTTIATVCYEEGANKAIAYLRKHRVEEAKTFLETYQGEESFTFEVYSLPSFVS